MSARPTGRRVSCTVADARARLGDAEAFLEAARMASNPDVVATTRSTRRSPPGADDVAATLRSHRYDSAWKDWQRA